MNALPGKLHTSFGMTELGLYVTYTDDNASFEALSKTIGRPHAGFDIRVGDRGGDHEERVADLLDTAGDEQPRIERFRGSERRGRVATDPGVRRTDASHVGFRNAASGSRSRVTLPRSAGGESADTCLRSANTRYDLYLDAARP